MSKMLRCVAKRNSIVIWSKNELAGESEGVAIDEFDHNGL